MCSGDNNLTFEGGMGDLRTERLISGENNSCHKIPGKKIPALKKKFISWRIVLEKNSYTVVCQEKILSPEVCEN